MMVHSTTSNAPVGSGARKNPIATIWVSVLSLPPRLAGMTP
jgi:hypothetical protein